MTLLRTAALATVVALAAVACGTGGGSNGEGAAGPPVSASGGAEPDFVATTLDGEELALADFAGQDVMLWFWAPW